jgi:microcystin-dependent protein
MTNYVKSTAFTSKDTLPSGNALKIVKGAELDTEFNNLATSSATKADLLSPAFTGTPTAPTAVVGTNTTQLATTAFVVANTSPTGSIVMWPTATAPTGFLLCNGATANRITYAALFAVIGTVYGAGDGSTTFNVPNFVNRSPIGAGSLYSANTQVGSKDAVVVSHAHTASSSVSDPGHAHTYPFSGTAGGITGQVAQGSSSAGVFTTSSAATGISVSTTVASAGVSGTDANLQPSLGIFFIIKT